MTILEILEAHDLLCMDDADDRATLADALQLGLGEALDDLLNADDTAVHCTRGIVLARDFIREMDGPPGTCP